MEQLQIIFNQLEMNHYNGLYVTSENKWKGILSSRLTDIVEKKLLPDAFFCIDDKPLVLFHFSGYEDGNPYKMSIYQNRHVASGNILKLYKEYDRRLNEKRNELGQK